VVSFINDSRSDVYVYSQMKMSSALCWWTVASKPHTNMECCHV